MPSFDDRSEFPPSRRGRSARAPRPRREASAQDWRHPDPAERYSQDYDDFAAPRSQHSDAEEWQRSSAARDSFTPFERPQRRETAHDDRGWDRNVPSWDDEAASEDPFNWDAPEEPGWRDAAFGRESYEDDGFEHDSFAAADSWDEEDSRDFATARLSDPDPQGQRMRDDSLFRRIDGSVQDPDLAALTGRTEADPFATDPFAPDPEADPSALGDRFFSSMEEADERDSHASSNVFPLDAQRAHYPEPDDPYAWDEEYDGTEAHRDDPVAAYAAAPDDYDDYRLPDDLHPDELHPDDELDADFLDDEPETLEAPVPERRSRRKLMVAGVLVAAVATGGSAAFVYKSYQDGGLANLEAPTLLADSGPVKGEPSDPGGKEFPDGNKQIYDRLSGEPAKPVADQTASDSGESASIPGIVTTGAEAPADTLDERIAEALRRSGSPSGQTDAATDPDSPRTVRTLSIRPDGSVAPAAAPEPPRPDEAQTVTTAGIIATSGPETDTTESASAAPEPEDKIETAAAPAPRPERAAPRPKETQVASAEPASTASTQPQTASANPYFVQLAARRDQTSALAAFADLQQKYPRILDGLAPTIKKADLGDKGVWYRLWVGPMDTRGNAEDVCGKLKSAGLGGCFVRNE